MSTVSDPELLTFSAELLEKHGGAIEPGDDRLLALLSARLAKELELPEEVRLGSEQAPLLYGSPVLDRLIGLATRDVPVVYGQIQADYLKKAGFEQLIGQDVPFADGLARIVSRAEARATYMALMCRYVALSDERKEGLVQVGIHEVSGALISGLVEIIEQSRPQFFPSGKVPPHFPVHLEQAVSSGMRSARELVEANLSDFLASMRRRLQRDVRNTRDFMRSEKGFVGRGGDSRCPEISEREAGAVPGLDVLRYLGTGLRACLAIQYRERASRSLAPCGRSAGINPIPANNAHKGLGYGGLAR